LVSGVVGSIIGGLVALLAPTILEVIGYRGEASSFDEGVAYLRWSMLAVPSLFTLIIGNTVFGVLGESRRALQVISVAVVLNIFFDYILIFGKWGFPEMGVSGGGVALCISQTIATILFLLFLPRTPLRGALHGMWLPDTGMLQRILHIGLPASARQAVVALSGLAIQALLLRTQSGSAAGAAHGIGVLVESLAFLPGNAFASTAGTFVSQNLGAGNVQRAKDAALISVGQAVLTMTVAGVLFGLMASGIAHLMLPASAPEAVDLATRYLQLMAFIQPAAAVNLVLAGVLASAGDTRTPRTVTFVTTGFRVLLAYGLSTFTGLGVMGVWLGIASTPVLSMALLVAAYRRGSWTSTKV
jgi:putative MATE family efflux protein